MKIKFFSICLSAFIKVRSSFYKRDPNVWVFGEWFGDKCCDNCLFLANFIASQDNDLKLYWIANKDANVSLLNKKIIVLQRDTKEALSIFKKCSVSICNQSLKDFSSLGANYFNGGISILLWHGVPWKKIFHDSNLHSSFLTPLYNRVFDLIFNPNYFLSPSNEFDVILKTNFRIHANQILHSGYPRNTLFYNEQLVASSRSKILSLIQNTSTGIILKNLKILTYMPTFRNYNFNTFDFHDLCLNSSFYDYLCSNNIVVIQKNHYVSQTRTFQINNDYKHRFFVFNDVNPQDLLCATDLLVTDYSGAFFDYLLLNRPIIHFLYDFEKYCHFDRGLYYSVDDVSCGPVAYTNSDLINSIFSQFSNPDLFHQKRLKVISRFLQYQTFDSSLQLYNLIHNLQK